MVTLHTVTVDRFAFGAIGPGQERVLRTMKQKGIAALLVLLLLLAFPVSASADVIYPAPEDFYVGVEVDHLLATLDEGGSVWTDPLLLPEGLRVETEENETGLNVYLRGVPSTPGSYDLLFRYNGTDSICTVNILPSGETALLPVALYVLDLPEKIEYTAGDTLDPQGLLLMVEFSDGSTAELADGYSLYPTRLNSPGVTSIEVSYEDLLCYFDVNVSPAPEEIQGIGVLSLPNKVIYRVGEELDPTGLTIRVYTNNGVRDQYTELLCLPTMLTEPGQQEIDVYYGDHMCSFTVQVLAEESPVSLAVYHLPDKLDYLVGDQLDPTGLVLIETRGVEESTLLEGGYTCDPTLLEQPGSQEITVELGELSCSFHVTVMEPAAQPEEESSKPEVRPAPATPAVIRPEPDPLPQRHEPEPPQSGTTLVAVILIAAMGALLILGVYVYLMNRSGREYFADSVKDLFRRK